MNATAEPSRLEDTTARTDRLLARLRRRQLALALRGRFADSFHTATRVKRLRRAARREPATMH